jgi:hypothetical protein
MLLQYRFVAGIQPLTLPEPCFWLQWQASIARFGSMNGVTFTYRLWKSRRRRTSWLLTGKAW